MLSWAGNEKREVRRKSIKKNLTLLPKYVKDLKKSLQVK